MIDEIPVYQRPGGGCAVVIDPGNIVISIVLPVGGFTDSQRYFDSISSYLIGKLTAIGIDGVYRDGVSDLVLNNRKIGGSSIKRAKDYLYYSTTLLVEPKIELIERYLKHPPREPEYRKGRNHNDFVGSMSQLIGENSVESIIERLTNVMKGSDLYRLY